MTGGKEKAISLNPKETVQEWVTRDKMVVAREVLADNIRWELQSREERNGANWLADWEYEKIQRGIISDEENSHMDHSPTGGHQHALLQADHHPSPKLREAGDHDCSMNLNNGMAKYLAVHHPDEQGGPDNWGPVSHHLQCLPG